MDYYADNLSDLNSGLGESALDMRKPLDRDKEKKHVRENGKEFKVFPEHVLNERLFPIMGESLET
jgi:hypothetical protein